MLGGSYITFQKDYNMAHWTPNQTMRDLGMPYEWILAYEHYLPWALHLFIAMLLTLLLYTSKFYFPEDTVKRNATGFKIMLGIILLTELLQTLVGKSIQISDLLFGLAGILITTLTLLEDKHPKSA